MKRTTVSLPDELAARLRHEARRRGMTISELTREAIEEKLHVGGRRLLSVGAGHSGGGNIAARIEELLADEAPPVASTPSTKTDVADDTGDRRPRGRPTWSRRDDAQP